jgi:hypothetical protein
MMKGKNSESAGRRATARVRRCAYLLELISMMPHAQDARRSVPSGYRACAADSETCSVTMQTKSASAIFKHKFSIPEVHHNRSTAHTPSRSGGRTLIKAAAVPLQPSGCHLARLLPSFAGIGQFLFTSVGS